ncbi:hypothetical protein AKG34_26295 [Peribacillus butanolivorans]|uniref:YjfA family protein n=1 Tax=Peribacillus butanolivorans TaxID=421767 RepID=UPI0006A6C309|nr:YjfA family protein [Peribacillus butanolivorans]KON66457.1 hypothetical protein AKG34_26295 [Peribacillus butanolivorans]
MKKIWAKVSSILLLSLILLNMGISAHAENHSYDGKSPNYNNCASSATTKKSTNLLNQNNQKIGKVELKFSSTCKTAWAKITMDKAVTKGYEANAEITRNTDGKRYSCGSSGGNGKVVAGQTSCYTPMVYDLDPRTSYAFGKYYGNGYIYSAYTGSY